MSSSTQGYDEHARKFWSLYVKESEQHDKNRMDTWKANMDSTLIFTGLFSAVVTAFLIDSYKLLQPDSGDETKDLLKQILVVQIAGASLNTSVIPLPTTVATPLFTPSASAVAVNVLWFLSLSCALATALTITLVQQWIRDYLQRIEQISQPQRRATIRGIMFLGSEKWEMSKAVEYIPTLLHFSLFSFFAGLCIFLGNINKVTAGAVLVIVVICSFCYGVATVAPLFDLSAPYETPFSYLLWRGYQIIIGTAQSETRSFAHARDDLASPSHVDQERIQQQLQAVSWVYDKTTDDHELQELVGSIPGLLHSWDGRHAWQVFLSRGGQPLYEELESRTVRLLKGCTASGYLDTKSRQLRAMLCFDALLAFSSFDSFKQSHLFNFIPFDEFILASWEDDGTLATKSLCAEALFHRRYLVFDIPRVDLKSLSNFDDQANRADQALRDIDDLHEILEDLLQESETAALHVHKMDIVNLLKVWKDVVNSLSHAIDGYVMNVRWEIRNKLRYSILPWYSVLVPPDIPFDLMEDNKSTPQVNITAYHILGYLRLHNAYPTIPDIPLSPLDTISTLWSGHKRSKPDWLDLDWHVCSGMEMFKSSPTTRIKEEHSNKKPFHHKHALSLSISREIQPITSLLHILKDSGEQSSKSSQKPLYHQIRLHSPDYCLGHLMLLTTRTHGPFSLTATIIDAIVKDEGTVSGLLILIDKLKSYKPTKPFKPSVIDRWLETICPCLSNHQPPEAKGSQIVLVLALLDILVWEREWSFEHPFPFSDVTIQHLIILVGLLHHQLPVELIERALGVTPHNSHSIEYRARTIHSHVSSQRMDWIRSRGDRQEI